MKSYCKFISLMLAVIFILCACQTTEPEIVPEYDTTVGAIDLGGVSLLWGWWTSNDVNFGYIDGTAHSDMALERKRAVEDLYNCSIEMDYSTDVFTPLRTSIMSGSPYYDLVTGETFSLVNDVRAGYLAGLSGLLDVENTDKWGTPNMLQSVIWDDDIYAVVPFAWPELMYNSFNDIIAVNEDLVSKLGYNDPREYVETNTWTWDQFEECLHQYTFDDGGRTIYGMATHDAYLAVMMFLSNGVTVSDYVDGKVVCGAYTDPGFVALERARKIYYETCKDCFHPQDPWNFVGIDMFVNEEMVMLTAPSNEIFGTSKSLLYVTDNAGILPYPQGPNAIPGVYTSYHSSLLYATSIPVNVKEVEATAAVLTAMYEPFDQYKTKKDIIDYMAEQIFFDERDARVFAGMLENTEYLFFLEGARVVIQSVLESTESITALLESHEDQYAQIVEDYMTHHFEGRVAVYGE